MPYDIILKPSAQKDLDLLLDKEVNKISKRLQNLSVNPRPIGSQKLSDIEGYRIRSGDYRVLYEVDDSKKFVFVYRIKHRREAYG
jgi:mRNA interferase RelE/StbE